MAAALVNVASPSVTPHTLARRRRGARQEPHERHVPGGPGHPPAATRLVPSWANARSMSPSLGAGGAVGGAKPDRVTNPWRAPVLARTIHHFPRSRRVPLCHGTAPYVRGTTTGDSHQATCVPPPAPPLRSTGSAGLCESARRAGDR